MVQFMGKDNVPFHTVIFPATLLGTGQPWTMMKSISVTEYLNYEDDKFSKSRGIGVFGNDAKDTGIPPEVCLRMSRLFCATQMLSHVSWWCISCYAYIEVFMLRQCRRRPADGLAELLMSIFLTYQPGNILPLSSNPHDFCMGHASLKALSFR